MLCLPTKAAYATYVAGSLVRNVLLLTMTTAPGRFVDSCVRDAIACWDTIEMPQTLSLRQQLIYGTQLAEEYWLRETGPLTLRRNTDDSGIVPSVCNTTNDLDG